MPYFQLKKSRRLSAVIFVLVFLMIMFENIPGARAHAGVSSSLAADLANQQVPRIETVACSEFQNLDVSSATVQCGYLVVPENRANPQSRTVKVAFAVIKTANPNPQPDPLVYLTGGPGDNAIRWISDWAGMPMSKNRDIILVDPRGVGYSRPAMQCLQPVPAHISTSTQAQTMEETIAQNLRWAQTCRDQLVSQGFDLTSYNSIASAGDLNDLRQALGYAKWNLYGTSYGTRVALVTMQAYPDGIRSVVLDSVLPPQVDRIGHGDLVAVNGSLATLFAACKADPACDRDYPNLETKFYESIQHLDRSPIRITVTKEDNTEENVWVNGAALVDGVRSMVMYPFLTQIAPIAIDQISAGNQTVIERLYSNLISTDNQAIYNTVLCHDVGALFNAAQFHAELEKYPWLKSYYIGDEQSRICQLWGAGQAGPAENQPVQSQIPTLLLAGGFDYASVANAALATSTLSHSYMIDFPVYGHYVTVNECPQAIMTGFLDDPLRAPETGCVAQIKGLPFFTNVYLNHGVWEIYLLISFPTTYKPWQTVLIGLSGVIFLAVLLGLPISAFRSRHQSSGNPSRLVQAARWMLWATALLNLVFALGVWLLVKKSMEETFGWGTNFGVSPASSGILFIIPWLTALLGLALLVFAILAWKNRWWGRFERVFFSLGTLAALVFSGMLFYWQVLLL